MPPSVVLTRRLKQLLRLIEKKKQKHDKQIDKDIMKQEKEMKDTKQKPPEITKEWAKKEQQDLYRYLVSLFLSSLFGDSFIYLLFVYFFMFIYLFMYLCIYLFFYLCTYLFVRLSIYLFIHLFVIFFLCCKCR
jgi:hypothetical protein